MSHVEEFTTILYVTTCPNCHVVHGIPNDMATKMRERGGEAHCPNGHRWFFTETEKQQLEKQLARERAAHDQTRSARDEQARRRAMAERRCAAARGQVTKIRNRVGNGICPCCNRSFENLHRHMQAKHPAWKKSETD